MKVSSLVLFLAVPLVTNCDGMSAIDEGGIAIRSNGPIEGTYLEQFQEGIAIDAIPPIEEPPLFEEPEIAAAPGDDTDGDGLDDFSDTCPQVANSSNFDADRDGYGNACDADYNGDGVVSTADFAVFLASIGSVRGDDRYDSRTDHNEDGSVSTTDFSTFIAYFNTALVPGFPVPFESVQAGDTVSMVVSYADGSIDNQTRVVQSVDHNPDGGVREINVGAGRLVAFSKEVLVLSLFLFLRQDEFVSIGCDRSVVFPQKAVNNYSQLCTANQIDGLSVTVSRL